MLPMPTPATRREPLPRRVIAPGRSAGAGPAWLPAARWSVPTRRALAMFSACLLLLAQLLLATHGHAAEAAHGDGDDGGPLCAVCLHKAAGHEQLGPVGTAGAVAQPLDGASAAPAEPRPAGTPKGRQYRKQARGPPAASRLA